jgi:hypothetical protein
MASVPKLRPMIYCPGPERWVTIGQYMRAVRLAKANPDREFKVGLTCWWACTGREIVRQFMEGVHDRINTARPYLERAGKAGPA